LEFFQWYRTAASRIDMEINDVVYDRLHNMVYLDISQLAHFRFSLFAPRPARVMSRLTLRKEGALHYVAFQEDFFHPDEVATFLLPPCAYVVRAMLWVGTWTATLWTKSAQAFGVWRVPSVVDVNIDEIATKPYKPRVGEGRLRQKIRRELSRSIRRAQEYHENGELFENDDFNTSTPDISTSKTLLSRIGRTVELDLDGDVSTTASANTSSPASLARKRPSRFETQPSLIARISNSIELPKRESAINARVRGRNLYKTFVTKALGQEPAGRLKEN